ncbi:MAG: class I SAM-dependent methyltransferase [candidate division WOR-3 bacterium]
MSTSALRAYRLEELRRLMALVESRVPQGAKILDVGAGAGWLAAWLAERGYAVVPVDLAGGPYESVEVVPIIKYDGARLPFKDEAFDGVLLSNVLEHCVHPRTVLEEVKRVLKLEGLVIVVAPSALWALVRCIAHYPYLAKRALARGCERVWKKEKSRDERAVGRISKSAAGWVGRLVPNRDGEWGGALEEIWLFRRAHWIAIFTECGWEVVSQGGGGVFYSGRYLLNEWLSIAVRRRIAAAVGSSSLLFALRRASPKEAVAGAGQRMLVGEGSNSGEAQAVE